MAGYLARRILGALLVMWAVATLVFFMMRAVPGDPLAAMLFDSGDPAAAEDLRKALGMDLPLIEQYARWLWQLVRGNFGTSIYGSQIPVAQLLAEALPRTLSIAGLSFVVALVIAVPAGIVAAMKKNSAADNALTIFAFLGLSMPDFWFAILLIILFAANLQWLPAIGYSPLSEGFWPWLSHLIMPALAAGTTFSAIIARMIRSAMIEVLKTDFLRTARSKGLTTWRILIVHALPNALIPVVTVMGIALALMLAGTVVVENVFAIKGLGRTLIEGILNRDYPVVQGAILAVSAIFIGANLVVDVLYTVIDPRIRYS
ncbi:ABC transporter permease [Allostella sp. ATCC 35155]|nr:ABC transporter permease [Stella sp. ATCC 35155]